MAYNNNNVILKIRNLNKHFGKLDVLRNINLDLHKQEVLVIIGPSGAGKSTLIRCINRLEEPTSGEIYLMEKKLIRIQIITN